MTFAGDEDAGDDITSPVGEEHVCDAECAGCGEPLPVELLDEHGRCGDCRGKRRKG